MPIVINISIGEVAQVPPILNYYGNSKHPNHRFHEIGKVEFGGAVTPEEFSARLVWGLEVVNRIAGPSHRLKIAGKWWVFAFRSGSSLVKAEEAEYEALALKVLGCESFHARAWHRGLNGAADLNIFDPGIGWETLPFLRRPDSVNLLKRARLRSDEWTARANCARSEANQPEIPTVRARTENYSAGGEPSIEQLLLNALSRQGATRVTLNSLSAVMTEAGFQPLDWEIDFRNRLAVNNVPGRKRKKRDESKPVARLDLQTLFAFLNLQLLERHILKAKEETTKSEINLNTQQESAANVRQRLRTTTGVIHAADPSEIEP